MPRPRVYATPSERTRAWKLAHPDRVREHNREAARRRRAAGVPRNDGVTSYGVSGAGRHDMYHDQGEACAICREPFDMSALVIDHDHATGNVRGLLCRQCNLALGFFRDDPIRMQNAVAYVAAAGVRL